MKKVTWLSRRSHSPADGRMSSLSFKLSDDSFLQGDTRSKALSAVRAFKVSPSMQTQRCQQCNTELDLSF